MAPPNPRVAKAFRAMRDIGITEEKVKPVLKKLLKLYDKNWELIEEENYRALADAIFDTEESEAAETKKKSANTEQEENLEAELDGHDEPERPLKRLRLRYRDSEASPSCGNTSPNLYGALLKKPKVEDSELPETCAVSQSKDICQPSQPSTENARANSRPVSPQPCSRMREKQPVSPGPLLLKESCGPLRPGVMTRSQSNSVSSLMHLGDRGKEPASPQVCNREKQSICESSSHPLHFKEPKMEPGIVISPKKKAPKTHALIKPKDEPFTDDFLPQYQVPIAVIHPESLPGGDSSVENGIIRELAGPEPIGSGSGDGEIVTDGAPASSSEIRTNFELSKINYKSTANLEMASLSSPFGEVKFYLSCSSALGRSDFHMPTVDAVLQSVEKKWLRTYGIVDPNFSAMRFVRDMCDCFVEVATKLAESEDMINVSPAASFLNNLCGGDAPGAADRTSNVLNGRCNVQCDGEAASSLSPPCNDTNGCLQLDKNSMGNGCQTDREMEKNGFEDANPQGLMVVQHHEMNPRDIRCLLDANDIAKGQERVIIPLVNEINSESLPSFHYIPQNVVYQNAYVNFSLARIGENDCCLTCSGDCLSSSIPCACAHEAGGEFAYNLEGLVKEEFLEECISMNRDPQKHRLFYCEECPLEKSKNEEILEPCKGHLVRRFIKECWLKCGCSKQCGNRVVQRGIKCKLQVFMTRGGKGWGLRTLENLPKGAFICEYVGEVLTNAELYDRISRNSSNEEHAYPVLLDADWNSEKVLKDEEALCLDATSFGNVARFINHRCFDSNLVEIPVEVETPDHHYYRLAFFTTRKVEALEELTWDYGIDFDDHDHPVKAFRCRCGSKCCRNIKRSSRSRSRR